VFISREYKGITNATVISKAIVMSRVIVATV
jgi:hypothetical protein